MPYLFTFREILNLAKEFGRSLPGKHLILRYFNIDQYARQKYGLISMCILSFDTNTRLPVTESSGWLPATQPALISLFHTSRLQSLYRPIAFTLVGSPTASCQPASRINQPTDHYMNRPLHKQGYRLQRFTGCRILPVTEKSTVPTITGKEKAGTGNMSSEDRSTGHRVLLVTENYRLQSIVGYNAVPILTGKKPASNPVLTAVFLVTEEIAGDKLVGQEASSEKIP